jgi:hypothetical protein
MAELSADEQAEVLKEAAELPTEDDSNLFNKASDDIPVSEHMQDMEELGYTNGKPKKQSFGARVAEKVREKKIDQGGSKSRNLSELRKGLTEIKDATESEQVKKLIAMIEKYIGGMLKTTTMQAKLESLFSSF